MISSNLCFISHRFRDMAT